MTTTPRLLLELVDDDEILGYVSVNEALSSLDALAQGTVLQRTLATPPGSPVEGAQYIVAASPTGAWVGHAMQVAQYLGAAWHFYVPHEGWTFYDQAANTHVYFDGASWLVLPTGGGGGVNLDASASLGTPTPGSLPAGSITFRLATNTVTLYANVGGTIKALVLGDVA